ncbi:MAG TPA: M56 family metallopeptidase [Sphingomicrobium sp.]|nr:M56 family metallopeptidase [Sphingomicrobium sp.]
MEWFIPFALKSFVIAGGALLLLKLLKDRSAADRSWIAHLALAGLLLLPVATVALPTLDVAGPEFLVGKAETQAPAPVAIDPGTVAKAEISAAPATNEAIAGGEAVNWPFWSYALPAALLVLLTLIALGRLFILKARATVLVDAPWLTALAHAQKRMGFKHGTALLTSNDLPSPISWGVVRPVIILNSEASESHAEAEAIITHELAHVAHLDWAKLLIARVATALFWFNPFVWLLAREAHQLREEAADDAVLATDIDETEYARLLVGVARHECRGLLIGAHGVAPARNSLSRRVKRVLDRAVKRAPGGWRWGSAAGFFAAGMAVPVAALNLVPATPTMPETGAYYPATTELSSGNGIADEASQSPDSLQAGIAAGIRTGVATGVSQGLSFAAGKGVVISSHDGTTVLRNPDGGTITIHSKDKKGRSKVVMHGPDGSVMTFADARLVPGLAAVAHPHPTPPTPPTPRTPKSALDTAIEMKALGVTAEYVAAIRAAAPQLRLTNDEVIEFKAVGVTPAYLRELAASGYRNLDADSITEARATGVTGAYIRDLAAAGYPNLTMDQLAEFRAVGVTGDYIRKLRKRGYGGLSVDKLVEMRAVGLDPDDLRGDGGG